MCNYSHITSRKYESITKHMNNSYFNIFVFSTYVRKLLQMCQDFVDDEKMCILFNPYCHYSSISGSSLLAYIDSNVTKSLVEITMCVTEVSFSYQVSMDQ